jgi:8-oxo-dGTP pyrophosphatase MutT (NUDIX family)
MTAVDDRADVSSVRSMSTPPRLIRSAGGVLVRHEADGTLSVLLGRRRRTWRLPKGKLEPGETDQQAAVREIAEETGRRARILAPLGEHRFRYTEDGVTIYKTAVHFLLADEGPAGAPDGEFEELAWFPLPVARRKLRFPAERGSVSRVSALLARSPELVPPPVASRLRAFVRRLTGR